MCDVTKCESLVHCSNKTEYLRGPQLCCSETRGSCFLLDLIYSDVTMILASAANLCHVAWKLDSFSVTVISRFV